jgi:hypothetical protein
MARDLGDTIGTAVGRVGREAAQSLMSKGDTRMRIDLSKVAAAAVDAALADAQPRKRLTAPRAIVAGATLAIAARYAVTKAPSLPRVPGLSAVAGLVPDGLRDHIPDGLRDRLAVRGWLDDEAERDDEDLEADAPDVFDEGDEEPDAEAAPEPDDEAEEEPAADVEDEPDDEPEAEEDEEGKEPRRSRGRTKAKTK